MNACRQPTWTQRIVSACRAFAADEGGSAVAEYLALTTVLTTLGIATEHRVGQQVARLLWQVVDAFPR